MRCFYRERAYMLGSDYMDIQIYPVYRKAGARRSKAKPTSETQAKLNEENSRRAFKRLLHANFTRKDLTVLLTYDDEFYHDDDEKCDKDIKRFWRKLRKLYKDNGCELKAVFVKHRGKKNNRLHCHVVINGGVERSKIEALWEHGWTSIEPLRFESNGINSLGMYLHKQKIDFQAWRCTRNLIRPKPIDHDYKLSASKVKELVKYSDSFEMWCREYPGYAMCDKVVKGNDCADKELGARYAGNYIYVNLVKLKEPTERSW